MPLRHYRSRVGDPGVHSSEVARGLRPPMPSLVLLLLPSGSPSGRQSFDVAAVSLQDGAQPLQQDGAGAASHLFLLLLPLLNSRWTFNPAGDSLTGGADFSGRLDIFSSVRDSVVSEGMGDDCELRAPSRASTLLLPLPPQPLLPSPPTAPLLPPEHAASLSTPRLPRVGSLSLSITHQKLSHLGVCRGGAMWLQLQVVVEVGVGVGASCSIL